MSRVKTIGSLTVLSLVFLGVLAALAQTAQKPPTELYVRTTPTGATVFVDDKQVGPSPSLLEVEPGDHSITVKLAGHQPRTKKVTVREGRIRRVILELQRQPKARDQKLEAVARKTAWGEAVEGVQLKAYAEKPIWIAGDTPALRADMRNTGGNRFKKLVLYCDCWELELDGRWYQTTVLPWGIAKVLPFGPGTQQTGLVVPLWEHLVWQSKDGNKPLQFLPGRHTIRVAFCLSGMQESEMSDVHTRRGPETRKERVVSRAIQVEVRPESADQPAWGPAVEGVQCRVRAERPTWPQGTVPKLLADLRNGGKRNLRIALEHESWEIEIDGTWHKPDSGMTGRRRYLPLPPGGEQQNLEVWISDGDNLGRRLRALQPGRHTLRVARLLNSSRAPGEEILRLVSNPIEIEITPAEVQPKAPGQEPAWGKQVENLQCRIRAEKAAWTAGTMPKLFGDLRSYDTWHPDLSSAPENWEIEIDGKWHKNQRAKLLRSHRYKLLRVSGNSTEHDVREVVYQLAIDAEQSAARSLRALAPGKHVLRAGYRFGAFPPDTAKVMSALQKVMGPHGFSRSGKAVRVVSNPIEIEILPAESTTASAVSGKRKLAPRKLFSASHGAGVGVLGVAFSPDGLTVAAVDEQGKITLCDARSGAQRWGRAVLTPEEKKLLLYEDRKGRIHTASIAYSPDGYTLAVAADPVVRLYDAQSGRLLRTLQDKVLAVKLRDLNGPPAAVSRELELLEAVPHAHGRVYSVAFSPDGKLLATSGSHLIRADGSSVISAEVATQGKLKLWDAKTGELKQDLGEHFSAVRSVAFSRDGKALASLGSHPPSWTRSVRLWDPQTGAVKSILPIARGGGPEGPVAFSPDGKLVAAGALVSEPNPGDLERGERSCRLLVFNARSGALVLNHRLPGLVTSLSFSADGKTLAAGVDGRGVTLWDSETLTQKGQIQPSTDAPRNVQVAFSPTGNLLAVGTKNKKHGFLTVWEIGQGEPVASPRPESSPRKLFSASHDADVGVLGATFSPDAKTVAAVDAAAKVTLRDARSGTQITSFDLLKPEEKNVILHLAPDGRIHSGGVAFSPDGKTLAVGGGPCVKLFDAQTRRLRLTLEDKGLKQESEQRNLPDGERWAAVPRAHGSVSCVAFSPDGTLLATSGGHIIEASGAMPGQLKLWDAKTGELKRNLGEHFDAVRSVAFSPDGKILASAARHPPRWTSSVRSWDPQTGTVNSVLAIPRGDPWSVAFSPDGKLLAAGGIVAEGDDATSGMLLVWKARALTPLLHRPVPSLVASVALSADGKTLAAGEYGKGVTLWDPETGKPKGEIQPQTDVPRDLKGTVCVAFSPTGSLLAIGAANEKQGFLSVWDLGQPGDRTTTLPPP